MRAPIPRRCAGPSSSSLIAFLTLLRFSRSGSAAQRSSRIRFSEVGCSLFLRASAPGRVCPIELPLNRGGISFRGSILFRVIAGLGDHPKYEFPARAADHDESTCRFSVSPVIAAGPSCCCSARRAISDLGLQAHDIKTSSRCPASSGDGVSSPSRSSRAS